MIARGGNVRAGRAITKGLPDQVSKEIASRIKGLPKGDQDKKQKEEVEKAFTDLLAKADAVIEGTYSVPVITHVCLEPHGLTARWDGPDKLTVWASTQAVQVVAGELAGGLGIPVTNVTVLTDYMGGGFGSKFGADVWGPTAAELAKKAGGGRSRSSWIGSRNTWPPATGPAPPPESRSVQPRTARSSR